MRIGKLPCADEMGMLLRLHAHLILHTHTAHGCKRGPRLFAQSSQANTVFHDPKIPARAEPDSPEQGSNPESALRRLEKYERHSRIGK